jgi:peroxiredoxin
MTRPVSQARGALAWMAAAVLVAALVLGAGALYVRSRMPPPPPRARETAADRRAPRRLVRAADAVGFHPNVAIGVGEIESRPASAATGPAGAHLLRVGSSAPAFALRTPEGGTVRLDAYRGRVVMLEFFATWCPHCVAEAPHLAALARRFAARGAAFLAVDADSETAPSVYAFHRYFGIPYPALVDVGRRPGSFAHPGGLGPVASAYRVAAFPTFYLVGRDGTIRWRSDGEQPDALLAQRLTRALGRG